MPADPYLELRQRVQRRMAARLALREDEVNVERSMRQVELALGLPGGHTAERDQLLGILAEKFDESLLEERVRLSEYEHRRLFGLVVGDLFGLGPLEVLTQEPGVSAASVLDVRGIYLERGVAWKPANATFDDARQLDKITRRIFEPLGYGAGEASGLASGHLPDGSRVDGVLSPDVSPAGSQLVVRVPREPNSLDDLVAQGWLPNEVANFLGGSLVARRNVLVAGAPRSGKTTLLAALADSLAEEAHLLVVEQAYEMAIARQHVVRLEAQPQLSGDYSADALLRRAPDFLPDWVWLGEVTPDVAATYVALLSQVGLCASLALRDPGGPASLQTGPTEALDRLALLALSANPALPADIVEQQVAAGLDLLVLMGPDTNGAPRVRQVTLVRSHDGRAYLEPLYAASDGSTEAVVVAGRGLVADTTRFTGLRIAEPGSPAELALPLVNPDGALADVSLDELALVDDGLAIGLREEKSVSATLHLPGDSTEASRLLPPEAEGALLWGAQRDDGTRVAVARPPVSVTGDAFMVERFAAHPGGLKRLAELGILTRETGTLLVKAARAGLNVLVCGPPGSGKRALAMGLHSIMPDVAAWQLLEVRDADALARLLPDAGASRLLAVADCGDSVDPLAVLGARHALWTGQPQPDTPRALAQTFGLVARMGRVGQRRRTLLGIEEPVAEGDGYRMDLLFAARHGVSDTLNLVPVGEPSFQATLDAS